MSDVGRFMVAVSAVLGHAGTGDVLLLRRARSADFAPGVWEDVSGRVRQGECPEDALLREIREETGIQDAQVTGLLRTWRAFRGLEQPEFEVVGVAHSCRTTTREVVLSDEHEEYRWLRPEEALVVAGSPGIQDSIRAYLRSRIQHELRLIVVSGLPGTGKTTVAEHIGRSMNATVISLAWLLGALRSSEIGNSARSAELAYDLLSRIAEHQLRLGRSVVLDSMAGSMAIRERWRRLAIHYAARLQIIECVCSDATVHRQRVDARRGEIPDWPDPDWSHVERMSSRYEPWHGERLVIDGVDPIDENLEQVAAYVGA
jgi:predicted kinase/8-oxo-dGTP pyrophosphatase MutT (NUDIX family)